MDMTAYRANPKEQARIRNLVSLLPQAGERALDIGARDGYLSRLLAERFDEVVALDLRTPRSDDPRVTCVQGNAAQLPFGNGSFDLVLCAEVLEHVPPGILPSVCREILRVTRRTVLIGVPYKQDLRLGRTTCSTCGHKNPPWGHVNTFDEAHLRSLFDGARQTATDFVGTTRERTNIVSAALMDLAGNPYGTWEQEESCVRCGGAIGGPNARNVFQRICTRIAVILNAIQATLNEPRGNWIHVRFEVG